MLSVVSPELELILCCARSKLGSVELQRIKTLLQQTIDWDYFITTAKLHKVTPLMYLNLAQINNTEPGIIPPEIVKRLQGYTQAITRSNLLFVREFLSLIQLFQNHNISAIPYKGLVLAASVYGDLSLRQFADLDFLVSRTEYIPAQQLLTQQGYYAPPQNDVDWERGFLHPQKKIGVDLHQGLTPVYLPVYIDFSGLWERMQPVSIGGATVHSFSPEDLLIILCVQLAKDSQWTAEVLLKVCDIAELLRINPDLDWNFIQQQCTKLGTKRISLFSLGVAQRLLQAKLPIQIQQRIETDIIAQTAIEQVCSEFFQRSEQSFRDRTYVERPYLMKLARERWQDKVKYFCYTAIKPNEEDTAFISLPQHLSFIYYVVRPIRLILKYLGYQVPGAKVINDK